MVLGVDPRGVADRLGQPRRSSSRGPAQRRGVEREVVLGHLLTVDRLRADLLDLGQAMVELVVHPVRVRLRRGLRHLLADGAVLVDDGPLTGGLVRQTLEVDLLVDHPHLQVHARQAHLQRHGGVRRVELGVTLHLHRLAGPRESHGHVRSRGVGTRGLQGRNERRLVDVAVRDRGSRRRRAAGSGGWAARRELRGSGCGGRRGRAAARAGEQHHRNDDGGRHSAAKGDAMAHGEGLLGRSTLARTVRFP